MDDVGSRLFKLRAEDFEARERVRLEFHGVDGKEFGVVFHKCDEVVISFARSDFVRCNIGVDDFARGG